MSQGFSLTLYPYCGGRTNYIEDGEADECRKEAARLIRRHRNLYGYPVSVTEKGARWELETGEDARMIGDTEGILVIKEIEEPDDDEGWSDEWSYEECRDCGEEFCAPPQMTDGLCSGCRERDDYDPSDEYDHFGDPDSDDEPEYETP